MRVVAVLTSGVLAAIGILHASWAIGVTTWPGEDRTELSKIVVGSVEPPPMPAVLAVAVVLLGAAGVVLAREFDIFGYRPARLVVAVGVWALAVGLFARAAQGFAQRAMGYPDSVTAEYRDPDVLIYSPLCAVLCLGVALTAWRTRRRVAAG